MDPLRFLGEEDSFVRQLSLAIAVGVAERRTEWHKHLAAEVINALGKAMRKT